VVKQESISAWWPSASITSIYWPICRSFFSFKLISTDQFYLHWHSAPLIQRFVDTALRWYSAYIHIVIFDQNSKYTTLWSSIHDFVDFATKLCQIKEKTSSALMFHHTKQQHRGLIEISIQYAPLTEPLLYLATRLELPEVALYTVTKRCFVYARCVCQVWLCCFVCGPCSSVSCKQLYWVQSRLFSEYSVWKSI
jgi:hypothetical protein